MPRDSVYCHPPNNDAHTFLLIFKLYMIVYRLQVVTQDLDIRFVIHFSDLLTNSIGHNIIAGLRNESHLLFFSG